MSFKKTALDSIKGIVPDKLPYAPRFDIWFNAHSYRGTLPEMYRDCKTPLDIARKIGVGGHCVIPDYNRPEKPEDMFERGIGIYHLPQVPYRVKLNRVERTVTHSGYSTTVTYKTPKGSVRVSFEETEDMRNSGATISWITEHAIKSEEDYNPLIFLFENIEVEKSYEGITALIGQTGEDALVVANASMPGSPMQYIMRDLIDMKSFFMEMMDKPKKLKALAEAIGVYFERFMPIAASAHSEVLMFGANTDETITYPPFYEEHILPWVARFADFAHENGKYVLIHADGENRALFDLYRQSGIDILEAVATAPMTKSDIHEVLEKTEGMTVFGGIPSVILMPEYKKYHFERFMENTLEAIGRRSRFILGVSDTTPPGADFDRLLWIRDKIV
ncbi:MAG: hypothetical protein JXB48_18145 [Candidatus Latescibacteria bacterium]|nr:hypothetical protein [Candidatus Latescibacterota bacterium]